eukprot:s951_g28.t1
MAYRSSLAGLCTHDLAKGKLWLSLGPLDPEVWLPLEFLSKHLMFPALSELCVASQPGAKAGSPQKIESLDPEQVR